MGLTRDQIEHWNPDSLGHLADAMDQLAGIEFNGRAMADQLVDQNEFAQNPNAAHSTHPLETAGRLLALEDAGIRDSTQIRFDGEHGQAQAEYQRKSEAFDYTKKLLGFGIDRLPDGDKDIVKDLPGVPYGDLKDPASNLNKVVDMGGDPLKEMFTGPKPGDADTATIAGRDFKEQEYQVLAGTQLPPSVQNDMRFSNLFENGQLKPWDKMSSTDQSDLTQLFNLSFQDTGVNQATMESVYRPIVETDPAVKPPKKG